MVLMLGEVLRVINGGSVTLHNTTGIPYSPVRTREIDMLRRLYELVRCGDSSGIDEHLARMEEAEADEWQQPVECTLDALPSTFAASRRARTGGAPAPGAASPRGGAAVCAAP